jgi:trimethylamine:corrinoid methyltransferase-like protein
MTCSTQPGSDRVINITNEDCLTAILSRAQELAWEVGIHTGRSDLLDKANGVAGVQVKGNRFHVPPELVHAMVDQWRSQKAPTTPVNHPVILASNRATLFADHHQREIRPLARAEAVKGSKLLDGLTDHWVIGQSCGTPQDVPEPLRPIEQYMISYRYSRHGGMTRVPMTGENCGALYEMREIAEDGFEVTRKSFEIWVPSPMRLEGTELDELLDLNLAPRSISVGSMPMMGMSGPADPLGCFVLSLAETLGSAALLGQLYPGSRISVHPHPQPMDPRTGTMAFGTPEWLQMSLLEREVMEFIGLSRQNKECHGGSCMPDARAQSDIMASAMAGVLFGFTSFRIYPLMNDELWSHAQFLLAVEAVQHAWRSARKWEDPGLVDLAESEVRQSVDENCMFGEMPEAIMRLRSTYTPALFPRVHSAPQWVGEGESDALNQADGMVEDIVSKHDYHPPADRFERVAGVYAKACARFGAQPLVFD